MPPKLRSLKTALAGLKSLELLAPHLLRQRARDAYGDVGIGGEKLSAFINGLRVETRKTLVGKLKIFYPAFINLSTRSLRSGWKTLRTVEKFPAAPGTLSTDSKHVSDGFLRVLAILAQLCGENQFLLFDEIENGINPELIEKLVDTLVETSQQVMITTHSPMVLNYLEDEIAKESVVLIYKTPEGFTQAIRLFDIPLLQEKLTAMGPGEAFVDTYLEEMIAQLNEQQDVEQA